MKTKTIISTFLLAVLFFASGCEDKEKPEIPPIEEEIFPKEISFTEYSLAGTSCKLKLFQGFGLIIINSNEDLENYIDCIGESSYSEIDFSKYTLILAYGGETSSTLHSNCNNLQQISEQSYKMNVNVRIGVASVISYWQVPIIVNKMNDRCIVKLIVTYR